MRGTKVIETKIQKKKSWIQSNFFWNRRGSFRNTFFFHPMWFLAMGHVTRHMFKRCKQTRCKRNIFFYLNFFCFCSIIFYNYAFVLFLLYFLENRTIPIRSVSNGYCILDQNGTVYWTEPYRTVKKKPEWIFALNHQSGTANFVRCIIFHRVFRAFACLRNRTTLRFDFLHPFMVCAQT